MRGYDDDADAQHPAIAGLGHHGLFVVHNSQWKKQILAFAAAELPHFDAAWWQGFEHFVLRGKGGTLSCLARRWECTAASTSIEELRALTSTWCG